MADGKGGDGKIDLAELEKLEQKLGGVDTDPEKLRKALEVKPSKTPVHNPPNGVTIPPEPKGRGQH